MRLACETTDLSEGDFGCRVSLCLIVVVQAGTRCRRGAGKSTMPIAAFVACRLITCAPTGACASRALVECVDSKKPDLCAQQVSGRRVSARVGQVHARVPHALHLQVAQRQQPEPVSDVSRAVAVPNRLSDAAPRINDNETEPRAQCGRHESARSIENCIMCDASVSIRNVSAFKKLKKPQTKQNANDSRRETMATTFWRTGERRRARVHETGAKTPSVRALLIVARRCLCGQVATLSRSAGTLPSTPKS